MSTELFWYTNAGHNNGLLTYSEATHEEDLDGLDKLSITSKQRPIKTDKLVWQDNAHIWHEHIVDNVADEHEGSVNVRIECINSIAQLAGVEASGGKAKRTVEAHLEHLLAGTTWDVGWCSNFGVVEIEYYHKSIRECIADLVSITDGEMVTDIEVGETGVTSRSVRIIRRRGQETLRRAFTYKKNMARVRREVASDEVYTRVVGYGAKIGEIAIQREIDRLEAIEDRTEAQDAELAAARARLAALRKNEYADRLKVVSDSQLSLARWGVPMADGSYAHNTYIYTDSNCTDAVFLKKQCDAIAAAVCRPTVLYQFDIAEVDATMWWDVRLGNNVLCTDDALRDVPDDPNAGESKRVTRIKRNLAGRMSCVIEIGERTNPLVDQFIATERVSRSTTGNRSKVVARTPQFTGGNYSAGDYGWYDPQTDPSTPEGTEQGIPKPFGISITTPPTKLDYMKGERIDYGGMVVQLVNQDGSIFTDSNYPDGVIPFPELILTVQYAPAGQGVYEADNGVKWTANGEYIVSSANQFLCQTISPTNPNKGLNFRKTRDGAAICVAVKNNYSPTYLSGDWDGPFLVSFDKMATGVGSFELSGEPHIGELFGGTVPTSQSQTAADIMDAANVSVFLSVGAGYQHQDITSSNVPILDFNNEHLSNGERFERIIAFAGFSYTTDGSDPPAGAAVPVKWKSKYGDVTYEASFDIRSTPAPKDVYRDGSGGGWGSGGSSGGSGGGNF